MLPPDDGSPTHAAAAAAAPPVEQAAGSTASAALLAAAAGVRGSGSGGGGLRGSSGSGSREGSPSSVWRSPRGSPRSGALRQLRAVVVNIGGGGGGGSPRGGGGSGPAAAGGAAASAGGDSAAALDNYFAWEAAARLRAQEDPQSAQDGEKGARARAGPPPLALLAPLVVVLSADTDPASHAAFAAAGATQVLVKPVGVPKLMAIKALVGPRRAAAEAAAARRAAVVEAAAPKTA